MKRFIGFEHGMGIGGWLTTTSASMCWFIALWIAIEKRYAADSHIAFELLNQVRNVDEHPGRKSHSCPTAAES